MSANATIVRGYTLLDPSQAEIVREIQETLNEFQSVDILSPAGEVREKHWNVVTKFIALQTEFPEVAKQAHDFYYAESRCAPSFAGYNSYVFNLMMELRAFATATKGEDFTRILKVLRSSVADLACYSDEYDAENRVWR